MFPALYFSNELTVIYDITFSDLTSMDAIMILTALKAQQVNGKGL